MGDQASGTLAANCFWGVGGRGVACRQCQRQQGDKVGTCDKYCTSSCSQAGIKDRVPSCPRVHHIRSDQRLLNGLVPQKSHSSSALLTKSVAGLKQRHIILLRD